MLIIDIYIKIEPRSVYLVFFKAMKSLAASYNNNRRKTTSKICFKICSIPYTSISVNNFSITEGRVLFLKFFLYKHYIERQI
jgi:hypothetical protein